MEKINSWSVGNANQKIGSWPLRNLLTVVEKNWLFLILFWVGGVLLYSIILVLCSIVLHLTLIRNVTHFPILIWQQWTRYWTKVTLCGNLNSVLVKRARQQIVLENTLWLDWFGMAMVKLVNIFCVVYIISYCYKTLVSGQVTFTIRRCNVWACSLFTYNYSLLAENVHPLCLASSYSLFSNQL